MKISSKVNLFLLIATQLVAASVEAKVFEANEISVEFNGKSSSVMGSFSSAVGFCRSKGFRNAGRYRDGGPYELADVVEFWSHGQPSREWHFTYPSLQQVECLSPMPNGTVYCEPMGGVLFPSQAIPGKPFNNMGHKGIVRSGDYAVIVGPMVKTSESGFFSSGYTKLGIQNNFNKEIGNSICRHYGYRDYVGINYETEKEDQIAIIGSSGAGVNYFGAAYAIKTIDCATICGN